MKRVIISVLLVLGIFGTGFGQQQTDNKADQTLRSNGRVNPSTLGLEIDIPLGSYPGRGINVPVNLSYSSKVWRMKLHSRNGLPFSTEGDPCYSRYRAQYAENSASGWTSSLGIAYVEYTSMDTFDGNGIPSAGRCPVQVEFPTYNGYIRRIQIHLPSGESHELRASDTPVTYPANSSTTVDVTGTYYSVDGSKMKYVEDGSGTRRLYLPDGSTYDFATATTTLNAKTIRKANLYKDLNGNQLTFHEADATYLNGYWTDTLNRTIPVPLSLTAPTDPGIQPYDIPGFDGGVTSYNLYWKRLKDTTAEESGLNNFSDVLRYLGDTADVTGIPTRPFNDALFHSNFRYGKALSWTGDAIFNPIVLTEIELPNGQIYRFKYNIYGEIERIHYPTGGEERFTVGQIPSVSYDSYPATCLLEASRGVTVKNVYENANATPYTWTYSTTGSIVTANAPDGTKTERRLHVSPDTRGDLRGSWGFDNILAGMPYDERSYASGGQLMSKKLTTWTKTAFQIHQDVTPTSDWHPRVTKEESIVYDLSGNALSASTTMEYDGDLTLIDNPLNVKKISQYGFTTTLGSLGALVKVSETDYLSDSNYTARNITGLVTETRVLNPTNTSDVLAKSQFVYDEAAYFDNNYTTTGWVDPGTTLRGNVTTARTWNKDTNTWIESHTMFDNFGNVRKVWDTSGDPSRFVESEYDPVYKYAYSTKTKAPAPDPTGVHGTTEGSEISRVYDFTTGLLLSVTDANGQTATTEYDALLRPVRINPPAGGSVSETIYNDTPGNIWVKSRQQIDENNWAESTTYFDGLGRAYKSRTKDLQGDVMSQVKFDSFGRVEKTSNPYRVDASGNPTETVYWSKPRYDEANRVVETYAPAPDGQTGMSLGTVQFGISTLPNLIGTYVVSTDASGRKSRAISGIYGLMRVDEATGKGGSIDQDLGTLASPTQPTHYSYNIKGEMTRITQGAQNRYFMYDSFGRLTRVRQPEQTPNANLATSGNPDNNQWTAGYTYDVVGRVVRFTDAKGINIVNEYDKSGRATSRCYTKPNIQTSATQCSQLSGSQISPDTPQVDYYYDGKGLPQAPQFSKGSLTKITNGISEHHYFSFDNHRRLLASKQVTDGQSYDFVYKYNLSGGLIEETYPSGRIVKNVLDTDGGLSSVATKAPTGPFKIVATNFDYSPTGGVRKMMLGNGRWETAQFNERSQLTQLGLGNSPTDKSLWKVDYEYGELSSDGTTVITSQNTGSIARQTTTIPDTSFIQTYKYDYINRLTEAKETASNGTQNWKQTFGYDRFGNRTSRYQKVGDVVLPIDNFTLPTIDQATNRFVTGQGYVYDYNGNLIQDAEGRSFTFDANDKQIQVTNTGQQVVGTYHYDSSGARVKKVTESETTVFVYDAGGRLAAEYSTQPNPEPKSSYLTIDHLGSPRVITDETGNVISRRDFMPFGEEIYAGVGGRTEGAKYSVIGSDNIRKRFTGYEKDTETDLDYAQARMYGNSHGRFTTVDPLMASAFALDPQTFNRYTYTGNNPINRADPSGLRWVSDGSGIYWIPDNADWTGLTDVTGQEITLGGGCDAVAGCVGSGIKVRFEEERKITILSNENGGSVVNEVVEVVLDTANEVIETTAAAISSAISFAPTTDAPPINIPTTGPEPGSGPLEPVGGPGSDGGADSGDGELDPGASGDWQVTAAQLLYFLGNACYQTSCWEKDDGDEEEIELYRGVAAGDDLSASWAHERFRLATLGIAKPRGGHDDPALHNEWDTQSNFTSWTTNESVAEDLARYPARGVILTKKFPVSRLIASPDKYEEDEYLIRGTVTGASVKWLPPWK